MYSRWQRALPTSIRLVPVELPGRGMRMSEEYVGEFDELVRRLCVEHERHCHGRYVLYGHSMGALIAHGMAIRWREQARRLPDALLTSASPAPRHRDPAYFRNKESDDALLADLRRQGGTPEEVFENAEMLRITLDTLRADYRICAGYQYRDSHPLPVPICAFAGRQDEIDAERILGWRDETSAHFSVRWFEGGHFFIREHEAAFLQAMTQILDGTTTRSAQASAGARHSA